MARLYVQLFHIKRSLCLLIRPRIHRRNLSQEELLLIADLVKEYDAIAICDEVYEHMVYDQRKHIPLMTLPGMRDRSIRIGSAGKTF